MNALQRYHAANLPELFDKISKNSIGLDDYFERFFNGDLNPSYPPYNLINISNHESRLEVALAGFKKKEVKVYTEYGKLTVEGSKEDKSEETYAHQGLAQRSFQRAWSLSDDVEVRDVKFQDGLLTINLGKIVPEHHARKEYL